jgi:hypothetical protein
MSEQPLSPDIIYNMTNTDLERIVSDGLVGEDATLCQAMLDRLFQLRAGLHDNSSGQQYWLGKVGDIGQQIQFSEARVKGLESTLTRLPDDQRADLEKQVASWRKIHAALVRLNYSE